MKFDGAHLTIYLALWGAIGPLVGIWIGHVLSRSWQREQARLDNKKQEYKELMGAMAAAYTQMLRLGTGIVARSNQVQEEIDSARYSSLSTIHDRIYIAERLREINLFENWTAETTIFWNSQYSGPDRLRFTERFMELQELVRTVAIEDSEAVGLIKRVIRRFRGRKWIGLSSKYTC